MIIWGLLVAATTLAVDIVTDYRRWRKNVPVNHRRGAMLRVIGLGPAILLTGWQGGLLILSAYWMLFDGIYNWLRGFGWWFTGSDDPDDAKTDNLLQKLKLWQHIVLKTALIVAGVAIKIYL